MFAVGLEEDKSVKRRWRAGCGGIFIERMLAVQRIRWFIPGEGLDFRGGVEMDVGVDDGVVCWLFCHDVEMTKW